MLSKAKLNDMWQSGYCGLIIEKIKHTKEGPRGTKDRMPIFSEHVPGCQHCRNANTLKALEAQVAQRMGPVAKALFDAGINFSSGQNSISTNGTTDSIAERYSREVAAVMDRAMSAGEIGQDFIAWMKEVGEARAGTTYEGPKSWPN